MNSQPLIIIQKLILNQQALQKSFFPRIFFIIFFQVKVLYVRNLTVAVTEEKIQEVFEEYGKVERVKKIKDYAFVHFEDRDKATEAMRGLHRKDLMGAELDVSLAKPPSDKKKKEEMLRKREQRMMRAITTK